MRETQLNDSLEMDDHGMVNNIENACYPDGKLVVAALTSSLNLSKKIAFPQSIFSN